MEINRKAHPDCVYASNPYHECASACLERIAQGNTGRKHTKKQASKVLSLSGSFGKKKKEAEPPSPLASRPYQNGSAPNTRSPAKDHHQPLPPPDSVKKRTMPAEKKSFSSSSDEISMDPFAQDDSFNHKQENFSHTVPLSPNNMVDHSKAEAPKTTKHEHNEKSDVARDARSFSFLSPPISHDNDEESNVDDEENNFGEEIEVESVISESCVSVGKYRVKSTVSATLQSIIDKHGDIAANCKLESASMRSRYLECLCSLVQELKSTPVGQLTKVKVKEMIAVVKDLESVNIDVGWLRSVLDEFAQSQEAEKEKERYEGLMEPIRRELEELEADLARKEKDVTETRARVEETRARLGQLEMERSRLVETGVTVEKFRGKSFIDELL